MMKRPELTKMKAAIAGCFIVSVLLTSCGGASDAATAIKDAAEEAKAAEPAMDETHFKMTDLADLDLSSNGIPLVVKAPKGAKVMKYDVDGSFTVYGGKYFKLNIRKWEGTVEQHMEETKAIVSDKELNPGFDKFEIEDNAGYVKKNKKGELAFHYFVEAGGATYSLAEGMPYDISPDQFSDYPAEDVKLMYEAAKATVAK